MDSNEWLALIGETAVASSVAVLLVLLLRRTIRDAFGVAVAYALWWLVPAAIVSVLLPAPVIVAYPKVLIGAAAVVASPGTVAEAAITLTQWLAALWLAGALAMAWRFGRQQAAFRRALGPLVHRPDGLRESRAVAGLPAVVGLWRPMIVVPADFDARYTPLQRGLMEAHERVHLRRGDLPANAVATALRCVFWFNPLLHFAARLFRQDQELACDQQVIARHPASRRDYGEAMFKTQLAVQPLPLGCHWLTFDRGRNHPLKERIAMLRQPVPTPRRWITGAALVATLTLSAGFAAWASQTPRVVHAEAPAPPAPPQAPPAPRAPPALPASKTVGTAAPGDAPIPPPPAPPPARPALPPAPPAPHEPPVPPAPFGESLVNRMSPPVYPAEAVRSGISGKVLLVVEIDASGRPVNAVVERSEPSGVFDAAAIDAVMKWTFRPAAADEEAGSRRVRVPIHFEAPATSDASPYVSAEAAQIPPGGSPAASAPSGE